MLESANFSAPCLPCRFLFRGLLISLYGSGLPPLPKKSRGCERAYPLRCCSFSVLIRATGGVGCLPCRCRFPVFFPCFVCHFLALPPHFVLCFPLASFRRFFGVPSAFILFICSLFVFFRAYKITFQIFRFFPPGNINF